MSLVCPTLECGSACWDRCRGKINALDGVQKKVVQFTVHIKECDWETMTQCRTIVRMCALSKVCCGEGLGML
jgi:hypothetical protein